MADTIFLLFFSRALLLHASCVSVSLLNAVLLPKVSFVHVQNVKKNLFLCVFIVFLHVLLVAPFFKTFVFPSKERRKETYHMYIGTS